MFNKFSNSISAMTTMDLSVLANMIFVGVAALLCVLFISLIVSVLLRGKRKPGAFDVVVRILASIFIVICAALLASSILSWLDGNVYLDETVPALIINQTMREIPLPVELFVALKTMLGAILVFAVLLLALVALICDCLIANKKKDDTDKARVQSKARKTPEEIRREAEIARINRLANSVTKKTTDAAEPTPTTTKKDKDKSKDKKKDKKSKVEPEQTVEQHSEQPVEKPADKPIEQPNVTAPTTSDDEQSDFDWRIEPQKPASFVGIKDHQDDGFDSFDDDFGVDVSDDEDGVEHTDVAQDGAYDVFDTEEPVKEIADEPIEEPYDDDAFDAEEEGVEEELADEATELYDDDAFDAEDTEEEVADEETYEEITDDETEESYDRFDVKDRPIDDSEEFETDVEEQAELDGQDDFAPIDYSGADQDDFGLIEEDGVGDYAEPDDLYDEYEEKPVVEKKNTSAAKKAEQKAAELRAERAQEKARKASAKTAVKHEPEKTSYSSRGGASRSMPKAKTIAIDRPHVTQSTHRYVILDRSSASDNFSEYLKSKNGYDKDKLESSINKITKK